MIKRWLGALPIVMLSFWGAEKRAVAQYLYCTRPEPPYCIDAFGTFDDDYSFNSCKNKMEQYLYEINSYIECVVSEADNETRDVRREANGAVERFNCKARGETFCP